MEIEKIIYKCDKKDQKIIMRKDNTLNFTIKTNIFKPDTNIYVDFEKFQIENVVINMRDLQTIYVFSMRGKGSISYFLKVVGKGPLNSNTLCITDISNDDVKKIEELFDYFIFSDEITYPKLNSDKYVPILNESSDNSNYQLEKYTNSEIFLDSKEIINNKSIIDLCFPEFRFYIHNMNKEVSEKIFNIINTSLDKKVMKINNEVYILKTILPINNYKKYSDKRKCRVYESRFLNSNYIDIWQEITKLQQEKNKKNKWINFKIMVGLIAWISILILWIIAFLINIFE